MVNRERREIVRAIRKKYKARRLPIEFYQEVAHAFGGSCLSMSVDDSNNKLQFRCRRVHTWFATGASIAQGNWCGECQRIELAESRKWTLAMCQEFAASKGGKCLAPIYVNSKTPMEWECHRGHRWWQKAKYIKKSWCMECYLYEIRNKGEQTGSA